MSVVPSSRPEGSLFGHTIKPVSLPGVDFWPRAAARVIDILVHIAISVGTGLVVSIVAVIVSGIAGDSPEPLLARLSATTITSFVLALIGSVGYHVIFEGMEGSSVGKRILGFTVVREDGGHCTFRAALIRSLAYFVDSIVFGVVAYQGMQRSLMRQRYGDSWAHTIVVYRKALKPDQLYGPGRFLAVLLLAVLFDGSMIATSMILKII